MADKTDDIFDRVREQQEREHRRALNAHQVAHDDAIRELHADEAAKQETRDALRKGETARHERPSGPSVGRVVHYVAYGTPGGEFPAGICRAAVITEVYARGNMPPSGTVLQIDATGHCTNVGLCVLNPSGQFFNRAVPYDPEKRAGSWHWPERQ